jgi:hypothetical protein
MPHYPRPRTKLTPEQADAYAKLREGILAIVALDAPDSDNLEAWLGSNPNFGGPFYESDVVRQIALRALSHIREYDERTSDDDTEWERMVGAALSGA